MRALAALAILLALCGCADRQQQDRGHQIATSAATIHAAAAAILQGADARAAAQGVQILAAGIILATGHSYTAAGIMAPATSASPAPEAIPVATPATWANDPAAALDAAKGQGNATAATAADGAGFWTQAAGWALGALGLVIAAGKLLPGVGGIVAQVAGPIYDLVVSRRVRDAERRRDALAEGMETVVHLLDRMPPDSPLAKLKAKLADRLPPAALAAVNAAITAAERQRTAPPTAPAPDSYEDRA
jgi:hypothetical protein